LISYQCPACGGELTYSQKANKMRCTSCESEFETSQLNPTTYANPRVCAGCGAELETEENILSGFCSSCDRSFIDDNLLNQMEQPKVVVPFLIDVQDATENFRKWLNTRPFIPRELKQTFSLTSRNAYLMPFWLYNFENSGRMSFNAQIITDKSTQSYIIKEIKYYDVEVDGLVHINEIPCDAMEELEDNYTDAIANFSRNMMIPFDKHILAGISSKKYDYTAKDLINRAAIEAKDKTENHYKGLVNQHYSECQLVRDNVTYKNTKATLAYYPIYLFKYHFNGEDYKFYMNGQTGKIAGNTPISIFSILELAGIFILICFLGTLIVNLVAPYFGISDNLYAIVYGAILFIAVLFMLVPPSLIKGGKT
jgi:hypothetical protein